MLEREMGMPIFNLGVQHSGAGFYTEDDAIHEIIENAQVVFVEAPVWSINPIRFTACIPCAMIDL